MYFAITASPSCCGGAEGGATSGLGGAGFQFASATAGTDIGWELPRWHVLQVTSMSPLNEFLLMPFCMSIMWRAASFGFLSSLSNACSTWQKSHSTPSDAEMNCIAGMT